MIKVLDSIMGSGKTSYAIQMINENPEKKYIYITPYLNEVERVLHSCSGFKEPEANRSGDLKIDSLNDMLEQGVNIVSTHALFKLTTKKTIDALRLHNYTLILDEVVDVVSSEDFKKDDLATIVKAELAHVDEQGYLIWNSQQYDGAYNKIKRLCNSRSVIVVKNTALVWVFPATIFKMFSDTYICTYLFDVQIQKYYFDLHGITYDYYRIIQDDKGRYKMIPKEPGYIDDTSHIHINIYEGKKNDIGSSSKYSYYALSSTWYSKATNIQLKRVKDNLVGWFKNDLCKSPSDKNLWTCYKNNQKDLQASPYTKGFLACNARATNLYKDKTAVAYVINRFISPIVIGFFEIHNIKISSEEQEKYALSELLQFVWRSAIREHKEISLYIPSSRMRNILKEFLVYPK